MVIRKTAFALHLILLMPALCIVSYAAAGDHESRWRSPFADYTTPEASMPSDTITLGRALSLVYNANPALKAGKYDIDAAERMIDQAGKSPNPEFSVEAEEVSGNAPGFAESEINITLSQELELWGKKGARKRLAVSDAQIVRFETLLKEYELYALTVERFAEVAHAQNRVRLLRNIKSLNDSIAETVKRRVEHGATLQTEYILSSLEAERTELELMQAETELTTEKQALSSLWAGRRDDFTVAANAGAENQLSALNAPIDSLVELSAELQQLELQRRTAAGRANLSNTEGKPNLTVSGGVKRLESINSNSFIVGASLPLPLFNRNQGATASLQAREKSLRLSIERAELEARAKLEAARRDISLLISRARSLETALIPRAEEANQSLKRAYENGRTTYSLLLEGRRLLVNLKMELNDITLSVQRRLAALEREFTITLH